jgi:uncharacterized LabA/DUF88 family protein
LGKRVTCLVDGFNLLFSARESRPSPGERRFQWLDVRGLLLSYLSVFGRGATLREIHFFTAIPGFLTERDPSAVFNFKGYLEALHSTGVHLHIATFKRKDLTCPYCGKTIERHEEKETDVALGVKALELLHLRACDTLVIVSGDTDFAPALRTAKRLFPEVNVCVAFPHARFNAELQQIADFSFRLRAARYAEYQLPDPVRLPDGRVLRRPPGW